MIRQCMMYSGENERPHYSTTLWTMCSNSRPTISWSFSLQHHLIGGYGSSDRNEVILRVNTQSF